MTIGTNINPNPPSRAAAGSEVCWKYTVVTLRDGHMANYELNDLGDRHWEMCGIQNTQYGSVIYFKRPITPNTKLSGGGPLSNKTTEAESRRPLE